MGMKAGNLPHWQMSLEENAFKKYEVINYTCQDSLEK